MSSGSVASQIASMRINATTPEAIRHTLLRPILANEY
jgi:hypothetical protein